MPVGSKRDWSLHPAAWRRLLDWLDEGTDSGGGRYLEMRGRLVSFFGRKNCLSPDDLADETLTRIARRLEEEGGITDSPPARYCYIVARFVFLEYQRKAEAQHVNFDETVMSPTLAVSLDDHRERRSDCLDYCLRRLDSEQRALIMEYYCGDRRDKIEGRRRLAERLGISLNAVAIRACRIRDKLEDCLGACCAGK